MKVWWKSLIFYTFVIMMHILQNCVLQVEFLVRVLKEDRKGWLLKKSSNLNRLPLQGGGTWYLVLRNNLQFTWDSFLTQLGSLQQCDLRRIFHTDQGGLFPHFNDSHLELTFARFVPMHLPVWTVLAYWPLIQDQNVPGDNLKLVNTFIFPSKFLFVNKNRICGISRVGEYNDEASSWGSYRWNQEWSFINVHFSKTSLQAR